MKINTNKKSISSNEINATKNFDALAKTFASGTGGNLTPKTPKFKGWFVGGIATLAVATAVYFAVNKTNIEEANVVQNKEQIAEPEDSIKKTPVVNPLLASADIPKKVYKINADKGGKINHFTGTEITIPAGAFKDEEGNIIKGEVEIQYREFHDQADIFLSGIPMEYDTAGEKMIFESAGMMEIRGFQKGKRLKIVADKNFRICMHSKNPDPKFNLYSLNETNGKWNYEGKDSVSVTKPKQIESEIVVDDTTSFYDYPKFEEGLKKKEKNDPKIKEVKKEIVEIKKEIKKIKKTEPAKPKKATKTKKNFTIDVVKGEFPELSIYSGTIFEVKNNDEMPEDVYKVTWNDINLKKENNGYNVELSKGERKIAIPVIPVLEGKNYDEALTVFNGKFGEYSNLLTKKKEEERVAEVKLEDLKKAYENQRRLYQEKMIAQQEAYEIQRKNALNLQTARNELKRVFNIKRLGVWNCDSPNAYPKGAIVRAYFIDETTGEELSLSRLDLIEKNRNACFSLSQTMQKQFAFNPKKNNLLWAITMDGRIAFTDKDEFKMINKNNSVHTFKMKVIEIKGKSSKEIKKLIKG